MCTKSGAVLWMYSLCLGTSAEQSITVRIHLSLYRHRDHGGHLRLRSNQRVLGIRDERGLFGSTGFWKSNEKLPGFLGIKYDSQGTIVSDICSVYGYCPDRSNQRQNLEEFFCPEELWRWLAYPSLDWLRAKGAWKMVLGKQSFGVFGAIFRSSVRFCSMVILKPQKISWKDPTSQISLF